MKVRELIALLLDCDPDFDVAYEHCYIDYCHNCPQEKLVELGDLRPIGYTRWIPLEKREPEDNDMPCLIAMKDADGDWQYYLSTDFHLGLGTAAKRGAMWMPLHRTSEDKYKRMGFDEDTIQKLLALEEK